ncbi:YqxA family protein [Bacillus sp. FSL M8-0277]|uniref:YqxA family protein n=1 Tax=Bacillus sp. FSL M8-0277 TaxID=2921570 RepID=UPI0030D2D537
MGSFMGKTIILGLVLLFGVFLGMQQANNGMLQMKGYHDPQLKGAFSIQMNDEEEREASILGTAVTEKDLAEKQKQLEEIESFNAFSKAGKVLSDGMTLAARSLYDWVNGK